MTKNVWMRYVLENGGLLFGHGASPVRINFEQNRYARLLGDSPTNIAVSAFKQKTLILIFPDASRSRENRLWEAISRRNWRRHHLALGSEISRPCGRKQRCRHTAL